MFAWAYCNSLLKPAHVDRLKYLKSALGLALKESLTALPSNGSELWPCVTIQWWSTPQRKVVRATDELGEKPKHRSPNRLRGGLARGL